MAEPHISLDVDKRHVHVGGALVRFTRKEFDVLRLLTENAGRIIERDELLLAVWGDLWRSSKTLDMHVSWIRRKIGDNGANPQFLFTVRGLGFRLEPGTAEVVSSAPPSLKRESSNSTRVLLVKPGDVLVFGNVGQVPERVTATAGALRDQLRLAGVVLFSGDVDMAAIPAATARDFGAEVPA